MPDAEYRKLSQLSKHDSDEYMRNPFAYFKRKETGYKREPSEAMKLGTALHMKVLEPDLFDKTYVAVPESIKVRRGKEWDAFVEANEGKECLRLSQYVQISAMASALLSCPTNKPIFDATPKEWREVVLLSELIDVPIKSKVDMICPEKGIIVDVKTATDASPEAFTRQCVDFGYDVQAAWYAMNAEANGIEVNEVCFFVVENEFPYVTGTYTFSRHSQFMMAGEMEVKRRLADYRFDLEIPEPEPGWVVHDLELPNWCKRIKTYNESKQIYERQ